MTYIGRVDIWFSAFLSAATLVSAFFVINTAYQTRQMYSKIENVSELISGEELISEPHLESQKVNKTP